MVLFFDFSSMPQADQLRAQISRAEIHRQPDHPRGPGGGHDVLDAAQRGRRISPPTAIACTPPSSSLRIGEGSDLAVDAGSTGDETEGEDNGDAFTADETEFNIFNTDRKLSALESAAQMLSSLPEKKALVYFSSGVSKTGLENESQLRSTINAAVRANVSFYPVDARGLVATAPAGDADQRLRSAAAASTRAGRSPAMRDLVRGSAGDARHARRRYRRQGAARQQ